MSDDIDAASAGEGTTDGVRAHGNAAAIDAGGGRSPRRHHQRLRILAAAEDLIVRRGVEQTRLRDVADAAGVSVGTIQHYFDTRERLIAELFDWSSSRRLEAWTAIESRDTDPWRRIETLIEHALAEPLLRRSRIWIEFLAMARDPVIQAKLPAFYDAWRPPFREAIADGIAAGIFRPALRTEALVDLLIIHVDGAQAAMIQGAAGIGRERLLATLLAATRSLLRVDLLHSEAVAARR